MARDAVNGGGWLTDRLRLKPIDEADVGDMLVLHADAGISAWNDGPWTHDQAASFASDMQARWRREGVGKWLAYDRADDSLVGRGGLSRRDILGQQQLEVGWQIREHLWGRGFATEIGHAALMFAFGTLDAEHVIAFTEVNNTRSRHVMIRLGMQYQRTFHHHGFAPTAGIPGNTRLFVLYRIDRTDQPPGAKTSR